MKMKMHKITDFPEFEEKIGDLVNDIMDACLKVQTETSKDRYNIGINALLKCLAIYGRLMKSPEEKQRFCIEMGKTLMQMMRDEEDKL